MAVETVRQLQTEIEACRLCVQQPQSSPLPHEPRPVIRLSKTARLCIAGQAPGIRVHETGLPFNDPSGDRLRNWMAIDRSLFYDTSKISIVPMGFCFPGYDKRGADLPPRKQCRLTWHDRIFAAMPQIELILVIGQYAQAYHLGRSRKASLTETVRQARNYWQQKNCQQKISKRILPLPHPSWRNSGWLKKNPWFAEEILPIVRSEVARLTT